MQMLLVGRALLLQPRLLLLDEPSMGLAPMLVDQLFDAMAAINKQRGMAMLLVEQNARAALEIADYGYVIENGRIVLHGTPPRCGPTRTCRSSTSACRSAPREELPRREALQAAQALARLKRASGHAGVQRW